jgi:hypothetical protein
MPAEGATLVWEPGMGGACQDPFPAGGAADSADVAEKQRVHELTDSPRPPWTAQEVALFEEAIYGFRNCFHRVSNHVGTRSTKEVVAYYYDVWKRDARYAEWLSAGQTGVEAMRAREEKRQRWLAWRRANEEEAWRVKDDDKMDDFDFESEDEGPPPPTPQTQGPARGGEGKVDAQVGGAAGNGDGEGAWLELTAEQFACFMGMFAV